MITRSLHTDDRVRSQLLLNRCSPSKLQCERFTLVLAADAGNQPAAVQSFPSKSAGRSM